MTQAGRENAIQYISLVHADELGIATHCDENSNKYTFFVHFVFLSFCSYQSYILWDFNVSNLWRFITRASFWVKYYFAGNLLQSVF